MADAVPKLPSMEGKTCVVTGGTAGIGAATAEGLARAGAAVVVVGRNAERCREAVDRLRATTGNAAVSAIVADLSVQAEVRRLADEILERCPRLDVLVNNAGIMPTTRQETPDGFERVWAVNHLAYFLLTNLLLDRLKASAPARIVNVASDAHAFVKTIDFDDLDARGAYRPMRIYGRSKLANILFTFELARRLEGTGVTVNCLHPGFVRTRIFVGDAWLNRVSMFASRFLAIPPESGARTSIYLASSPEVEGRSGGYYVKRKPTRSRPASHDRDLARRLWDVSAEQTGLSPS